MCFDQFKWNPPIASFQHGVLESRLHGRFRTHPAILPAIHAGMTLISFSCSVGVRKS